MKKLLVGIGIIVALGMACSKDGVKPVEDAAQEAIMGIAEELPEAVYDPPSKPAPVASDFRPSLLTTFSDCFGSAGGLTTVELDLAWDVEFDGYYKVIYHITGAGEDVTDNVTVSEDGTYSRSSNTLDTASCDPTFKVEIVGVS